jgi:exonuclease III
MKEFWDWLVPACDLIVDRKAVVCGDFNTGIPGLDGPADYRFSCATQLRDLATHGWRDAYRELHPTGSDHSWWNKGRGFRIDHCMLGRVNPILRRVAYVRDNAGHRLVRTPPDEDGLSALSDHAALVIET